MCGHVGVASKHLIADTSPLNKAVKELLYLDAIRGWDATGILSVLGGKAKATKVIKRAEPAADFLSRDTTDKFLARQSKLFIGHNRAATAGLVDDKSSHPFIHSHITMAHNGTLYEHNSLPRKEGKMPFTVDSEAICHALSLTEDPKEVLEQLSGAFALVWYDQRQDTLNFARNDERPFYYAVNTLGTELLWASDESMLQMVIARKMRVPANFSITQLPAEEHLAFNMTDVNFNTPSVSTFQGTDRYWNNYYSYTTPPATVTYLPAPTNTAKKLEAYGVAQGDSVNFTVTALTKTPQGILSIIEGTSLYDGVRTKVYNPALPEGTKVEVEDTLMGDASYVSTQNATDTLILEAGSVTKAQEEADDSYIEAVLLQDGQILKYAAFKALLPTGCGWCSDPLDKRDHASLLHLPEDDCLMHKVCHDEYVSYLPTLNGE